MRDCGQLIVSLPCLLSSRQSCGVWNLELQGFGILENKASEVWNLKCGWRCKEIFDTFMSLFEPLVRTDSLYEKPTVIFSPYTPVGRVAQKMSNRFGFLLIEQLLQRFAEL